ncbi:MAG: glucosyltransferase domain-containing protein [Rikenellaceae bacterium]
MKIKKSIDTCIQQIKSDIDLSRIKKSVLFAVLFGFIVHGSNFFNYVNCHDSMGAFYQKSDVLWKIRLGRFMQAVTIPLRGYDNIPLINGVLSLIFIGLSSYVIVKTLDIKSRVSIYFISALIITSISYIMTNLMYFHELDPFMLALLFASVGVYIFNKFRLGYIIASVPIALCCGLYQPYMSVAIVLLMILLIKDVLNGVHSREVIYKSIKAACTLLLAGVIYIILYKTIIALVDADISKIKYNNIEKIFTFDFENIGNTLFLTYWTAIKLFFFTYGGNLHISTLIVNTSLVIIFLILTIKRIVHYRISITNIIILSVILSLIPFAINIATFISSGIFHELMGFSLVLLYVLFQMIVDIFNVRKRLKLLVYGLLSVLIFNGASFANRLYVERSIFSENSSALSFDLYKEIIIDENFIQNNNIPIMIIGNSFNLQMFYSKYTDKMYVADKRILYLCSTSSMIPISRPKSNYKLYFKTDLNFVKPEEERDFTLDDELNKMPIYPAEGYMKCVRDTIFVKFPFEPQNFEATK